MCNYYILGVFKNPKGSIPPLSQRFFLPYLQFSVHIAIGSASTSSSATWIFLVVLCSKLVSGGLVVVI